MTRQQVERHVLNWKDYAVLVGLAINLLAVGSMWGTLSTKTERNVRDIEKIAETVVAEKDQRIAADETLRSEMAQSDNRILDLNERMHAQERAAR